MGRNLPNEMTNQLPKAPAVVGTIHSRAALREALRLKDGAVDFLEIRVDHFVDELPLLRKGIARLEAPLIVTVRHPAEGGAAPLTTARRADLYREFMESASVIDVELRSATALAGVLREAHDSGIGRIISWHDFKQTPSLDALRERWKKARVFVPDIIKFATRTETAKDFARLIEFIASAPDRPALSVMGMKEYGKVSRLALAAVGSILNYGFLGELQVPGQWSAKELKKQLTAVLAP